MSKQWTIVSLCNKKRNVVQLSQELASSSSIRKWRLQLLPYAVYQLKRWKTIQLQHYKPWSHSTAVSTAIQGWIVVRFRWINFQILVMSASSKSTALCDFVCFLSDLHGVVWQNFRFSGSLNISQSFDRAFRPNKWKEFRQKLCQRSAPFWSTGNVAVLSISLHFYAIQTIKLCPNAAGRSVIDGDR